MALSWSPSVETSEAEERLLSRCKKAKLFVFLRRHRHELFDAAFERELIRDVPAANERQRAGGAGPAGDGDHPASVVGRVR